ncbi:MAG: HAD-IIIA family hydrolase [Flavobacteriales bacterium]|nr:HAD-IIIA family hydrolase [Flavobacteriales bacterium]
MSEIYLQKLKNIKALIFDFDGVLSDGKIYVDDNGVFSRSTNVKDGYAIGQALKRGYKIAVISGGGSQGVVHRMTRLGVNDVFVQVKNKVETFEQWITQNDLRAEECLMMGDDEPDLPLMRLVGFSCCPANAMPSVRFSVDFVSPINGGEGCVRQIIDTLLTVNQQITK